MAADPGPSPSSSQPSPQLQAASSPGPVALLLLLLSLPPPPRDQVTAINATGSTCPSNAPVGGWGGPPPWPRLISRWQKSGLFSPQKPPLICFKGPAPHSRCLMARLGWGWGASKILHEWMAHPYCFTSSPHSSAGRLLWAQVVSRQG